MVSKGGTNNPPRGMGSGNKRNRLRWYWIGRQAITAVANDVFTGEGNGGLWKRIEEWLREPAKEGIPRPSFSLYPVVDNLTASGISKP